MVGQINIMKLYGSHRLSALTVEKIGENGTAGKAISLFKLRENIVSISYGAGDHTITVNEVVKAMTPMGLVGKDALDASAQTISAMPCVLLMSQLNEAIGGPAAHGGVLPVL